MKRRILLLALACAFAIPASAQLVITSDPFGNMQAPVDQGGWHNFKALLTRNVTFTFVGVPPPAQSQVTVAFVQDGTGGRVVTFGGNIVSPGCPLNASPNITTYCFFAFDSTTNLWTWIPVNPSSSLLHGSGSPSNPCTLGTVYIDDSTGNQYSCNAGAWLFVGPSNATSLPGCSTDTFTAIPTYTLGPDQCHIMTLTGNVTSITIQGSPSNHSALYLRFPQDGVGGRTVAFPGNFIFPTGFTFHTSANNQNNMGWEFDTTASVWRPILDFGGGPGGGGVPAGANGAVQINNGGSAFGASGNVFDLNSLFQVNEDAVFGGPNPVGNDIREFGGISFSPNVPPGGAGVTATCNGTVNISLSSASLFQNGGGISIVGCGTSNTMATPTVPTVTTNLARVGTGTGDITATGLTGATTYNYRIAAQNLQSAITASSATATITTGPASLGAQSVAITSCSRVNQTTTCLTATHGLVVNAEVKIRGMSDVSFNGNWNVTSVPDTTHFTYNSDFDTRTGASASATGGTFVYWNLNHITWSAVTNAYRYMVCSDRGSPGTFNLIGISKPSYPGGVGTDGSLYFDDLGTVTTYPNPPWPMPSTCPIAATNNMLTAKITGGAGTPNITVSPAAGQTLAGSPARADNNVAIKAAAVSNPSGSNVIIPAGNFTNYVTNSILDLSQIAPGATITVQGQLQNWGDTIIFGNKGGLYGFASPNVGGGASFAAGSYPQQLLFGAPGIHFAGSNPIGPALKKLELDGQSNGQTNVVFDGGGPNEGYQIDDISCNNGFSGSVDDMSTCLRIRGVAGASGAFVSKGRLSCGAIQGETNSETPCLYDDATGGTVKIEEVTFSGRGALFQGNSAGAQVTLGSYYCQGCNTPMLTVSSAKNVGGQNQFILNIGTQFVNDTGSSPLVTGLNSTGNLQLFTNLNFNAGGTVNAYTGVVPQYLISNGNGTVTGVSSEGETSALTGSGGALDGIFFSGAAGGAGAYANKNFNAALSTGNAYPIFTTGPTIAAPTVAPAAGGNLPAVPLFYQVTPAWPNGGTGPNSLVSASITPSGGNLSVTVTWTPLGTSVGCTGYYILRSTSSAGGGNITSTGGGFVSGCNTGTYTDSSNVSNGSSPTITSGGPSELLPGTKGINTTALDLVNDVTLSTQGGGTAYTVDFPANQPTTGNTFLSCTAANPAVCSWVPGGVGLPWNQIGNPTGALTLAMSTNTSTFNFTSALPSAFVWANTTAATVTTSQSSPQLADCGQAWTGATNTDCWTFQHIIGNGLNANITDTYGHTGSSTGIVTSTFPGPIAAGVGPGAGGVIIPQGPQNGTTGAAITLQGATSITPYNVTLPGAQPTTNGTFLSCSPATQAICTWSQGGLGVGAGAGPVMGYYISNQCPVFDPDGFCFNTPANTKIDNTCTWLHASTTITCTDSPFAASDVGKQIGGWATCQTDNTTASYTGAIATNTADTIAVFTDPNHVNLTTAPANDQTGVTGCIVWGNTDDTAFAAVDTALAAQTGFCPKVFLAAGGYLLNAPHLGAQPPGCAALPGLVGHSSGFGNLDLPEGFELEGRGAGNTVIHLGTAFPGTTTCNQYTYNSLTSCFAIPPLGAWRDFQMSGDGQYNTCGTLTSGTQFLIGMHVAKMRDMLFTNFCAGQGTLTNVTGIGAGLLSQFDMVNNSGFGDIGVQINKALSTGMRLVIENNPTSNLFLNNASPDGRYDFSCYNCIFSGSQGATGTMNVINNAGDTFRLYGGFIQLCPVAGCNVNSATPNLYKSTVNGSTFFADGVVFAGVNPGTNATLIGLNCPNSSINYFKEVSFQSIPSGRAISCTGTGSKLFDLGGNSFPETPTVQFVSGGSGIYADGRSLTGSCSGVATAASTLGLYGTGPNVTLTTCTSAAIGTGFPVQQGRVLLGLYANATAAGVNASSGVVTVLVNGVASAITCTFGTNNFCLDVAHTVSLTAGDRISFQFTTQAAETLAGVKAFTFWQ